MTDRPAEELRQGAGRMLCYYCRDVPNFSEAPPLRLKLKLHTKLPPKSDFEIKNVHLINPSNNTMVGYR